MPYTYIIQPNGQNIIWQDDYAVLDNTEIDDSNNDQKLLQIYNGALRWVTLSTLLTFSPRYSTGEVMQHIDFGDTSTMTLSGSNVLTISDKSINDRDSVAISGYTNTSNYCSVVNTSICNFGTLNATGWTVPYSSDWTMFMMIYYTTLPTTMSGLYSNAINMSSPTANMFYYDAVNTIRWAGKSGYDSRFTWNPTINTPYLLAMTYNSTLNGGSFTCRINGAAATDVSVSSQNDNFAANTPWTLDRAGCVIGCFSGQTEFPARLYHFMIVSTADIKQILKYEWWINNDSGSDVLPTTHPYYYVDPINI